MSHTIQNTVKEVISEGKFVVAGTKHSFDAFLHLVVDLTGITSHLDSIGNNGNNKVVTVVKAGIARIADAEFVLRAPFVTLDLRKLDCWLVFRSSLGVAHRMYVEMSLPFG